MPKTKIDIAIEALRDAAHAYEDLPEIFHRPTRGGLWELSNSTFISAERLEAEANFLEHLKEQYKEGMEAVTEDG